MKGETSRVVRLDAATTRKLRARAKRNGRSMHSEIVCIIRRALARRG
jgi:plasmid stability protein